MPRTWPATVRAISMSGGAAVFAILAAIVFAVAMLGGHVGDLNLVDLGLLLLALHFVWSWTPWGGRRS